MLQADAQHDKHYPESSQIANRALTSSQYVNYASWRRQSRNVAPMHVIARPILTAFGKRHADAKPWLDNWWRVASKAEWSSLADVRKNYSNADQVDHCLVFDKGNSYRLIIRVSYLNVHSRGTLLVKHFLTHAEYDKIFFGSVIANDNRNSQEKDRLHEVL
jgi:mRNA interferase HigB